MRVSESAESEPRFSEPQAHAGPGLALLYVLCSPGADCLGTESQQNRTEQILQHCILVLKSTELKPELVKHSDSMKKRNSHTLARHGWLRRATDWTMEKQRSRT